MTGEMCRHMYPLLFWENTLFSGKLGTTIYRDGMIALIGTGKEILRCQSGVLGGPVSTVPLPPLPFSPCGSARPPPASPDQLPSPVQHWESSS
jgi:hypothetical protein